MTTVKEMTKTSSTPQDLTKFYEKSTMAEQATIYNGKKKKYFKNSLFLFFLGLKIYLLINCNNNKK